MRRALGAMLILGFGSLSTIVTQLIINKTIAVWHGPDGVGVFALFQNLLTLSVMAAGLGASTALVRESAGAVQRGDMHRATALNAATWMIILPAAIVVVAIFAAFRSPIATTMLADASRGRDVMFLATAIGLTLAFGVQTAILNAHRQVNSLALVTMLQAAASVAIIVPLVGAFGPPAFAISLLAAAAASFAAATLVRHRNVPRITIRHSRGEIARASGDLLRFGLPYTASLLAGAGVLLLLPVIVLHMLDEQSVGHYRAATLITTGYLLALLTALSQDYYPRLSAAENDASTLGSIVNEQTTLLLIVGVPVIFALMAAGPWLVPLVYSSEFLPALDVLEWQLVGDVLKLGNWAIGFALLARGATVAFFLLEALGGVIFCIGTVGGIRLMGLEGSGVAFLLVNVAYFVAGTLVLRNRYGVSWSRRNFTLFALIFLLLISLRLLSMFELHAEKSIAASSLAVGSAVFAASSVRRIWQQSSGYRGSAGL